MLDNKQLILVIIVLVGAGALWVSSGKMKKNDSSDNSQVLDQGQGNPASQEGYTPKVDGVTIEVLAAGSGDKVVKKGDMIKVHYVGTLEDGTVFDSSVAKNTPFSFRIGQGRVIKGWDEGLMGMKVGEKRKLTIAPEMGYGNQPNGPIPANSTLIFEVELLDIQ